jgi:hypothetical protein
VAVAGVTLDDRYQFAPEVIVTREGATFTATEETVTVTWYDRTDDSANKLYKMKRSVSTDLGQTYAPTRQLYGGRESDPEFLPRHCRNSNVRFLGDFAGAEGDLNHGHSLGVIVSNNSSIGTQIHTSFSSLGNWEK